jgi:hypothetical protein
MRWSEPDLLERLHAVEVPDLAVSPAELVAEGERRMTHRRWKLAGAVLGLAASLLVGYAVLTGLPGDLLSVAPAAPPVWVAEESEEVTLLDDVGFGVGDGSMDEFFTISVSRASGDSTTTVELATRDEGPLTVVREEGPPGVEVFRAGDSYVTLWSAEPEVRAELWWVGDADGTESGGHQSGPFELAGQPMHYAFHPHQPPGSRLVDVLLSTESGVLTATGAPVHVRELEHQGMSWRLVWAPGASRWGTCDDSGCSTTVEGTTTIWFGGGEADGRHYETLVTLLPGDARDIRLGIAGSEVGQVTTTRAGSRVFVVGSVEMTDEHNRARNGSALDVLWLDGDGVPHSTQDLLRP